MINKDLRIVFFGTPEFVIPVLETLNQNFTIIGVVTTPDQKSGRKQLLTPTPVKQYCLDRHSGKHKAHPESPNIVSDPGQARMTDVEILAFEQYNNTAIEQLKNLKPDLFVVAAYGKIIPQEILDIPKFGSINIHPSLLPKYRGASPIQSAIFHGDEISGVTIIKMDEQMDHGPILYAKELILNNVDTFDSLSIKMFQVAAEVLPWIINDLVCEKLTPVSQDDTKATFCDHITKDQGFFDITNPPSPEKLDRMIRAYHPWPGIWTKWKMPAPQRGEENGKWKILKLLPNKKIQMEGKNPVSYKDFLNGYPEVAQELKELLTNL